MATDNGTPALSGSTILKVLITDANDNPPTFTNLAQHQANNPVMIKEGKASHVMHPENKMVEDCAVRQAVLDMILPLRDNSCWK